MSEEQPRKVKRGFAAMTVEQQREIASQGGRAAHEKGVAHQWSTEKAKEAGRKGGLASGARKKKGADETSQSGDQAADVRNNAPN